VRRVVSLVVLGVGVFALTAGLLLRFYAYPTLAKIPHDPKTTSVAQGSGVTALVFVPTNGVGVPEIRRNLNLTSTTFVSGDLKAPEVQKDSDVTSWIEATKVSDDESGFVVTASVRELCLDRFTGEAVAPCENQYVQKTSSETTNTKDEPDAKELQSPGLNFKFPFGTEKKTYKWHDSTLRRAFDIAYDSEDTIKGLAVYKFVQNIPSTKVEDRQVPGSLVGQSEPSIVAGLYYEVQRTIWVEPVTGAVIKAKQDGRQVLRTSTQSESDGTDVFRGSLELNDKTVAANVQTAEANISKLWLLTGLPVILWIAGGVLTLAGIVLFMLSTRRSRRTY
jgi:hypothetical protein